MGRPNRPAERRPGASARSASRSPWIGVAAVARVLVAAGLGAAILAIELSVRSNGGLREQIYAQLLAFALFLPAAWLCWGGLGVGRAGIVLVLAVGIGVHAAAFAPDAAPPLTTDIYRYAWDARVQEAGINPYRYVPNAPELKRLRDTEIWENVNRRDWATVYPPGAEASFLAARAVFGGGVRATTWLMLLAEGLAVGLLLLVLMRTGAPLERVAVLAWHPLAASEIAANGHSDALAVLAGAGLLAAVAYGRRGLAGLAVGAGVLVKLGPLFLVPALLRGGGRRFLAGALGLVAVGYLAYSSVGRMTIGSLFRYLDEEDLGSLAWWTLQQWIGRDGARALLLGVLVAVVAVVALRANETVDQVARSGLIVLGSILLTSAFLQPWYALWLLPFLVVTPGPAWLWLTGTLPLLYVFGIDGYLPWWVRVTIYAPFVVLAALRLARPARPSPARLSPLPDRPRVGVAIPVLDEAEALPAVLAGISPEIVHRIVVVDGGSVDGSAEVARAGGAEVVVETRPGYGLACRTGADVLATDVVVWLDGDGSDDPEAIRAVLEPVLSGRAALSLGVRATLEPGAQHWHQRVGNRFVTLLVRVTTGVPLRDIPPMRAIRRDALASLDLRELTYGWPTEMIVKAARAGLPIAQVEVPSRARRGGRSKVSGRLGPSLRAGARMLGVVARYA